MSAAAGRLLLLAGLLAGCGGGGGSLSGSLGAVYDVGFVDVRGRLYGSELAIEYVRADGTVATRVTARRTEPLEAGLRLTIEEEEAFVSGIDREGNAMPVPTEGEVVLDAVELTAEGGRVAGEFEARYPVRERVFGLVGSFDVEVEVVEWDALLER
jgi:hypothetical protein